MAMKQLARNFVKACFQKVGLDVLKEERVPRTSGHDLLIAVHALGICLSDAMIVQIGANNGTHHDPLHQILMAYQPRAILIEPVPETFDELKRCYESSPRVVCVNCAIAEYDGELTLYVPGETSDNHLGKAVTSFNKSHVLAHGVDGSSIRKVKVAAKTLGTVMSECDCTNIDILVVDTEGMDWTILSSAFNAGIVPRVVHFENCHLTKQQKSESRSQLTAKGYCWFESIHDTTAIKVEF